jgi:hypothetical protein
VPQYLGINFTVKGQGVKKPDGLPHRFNAALNNNSNAGNNRAAVKLAPKASSHLSHDADSSRQVDAVRNSKTNRKQQSDSDGNAAGSSKTAKKLTTDKFVRKSFTSATDDSHMSNRDTSIAALQQKHAKKKSSKVGTTLHQVLEAQDIRSSKRLTRKRRRFYLQRIRKKQLSSSRHPLLAETNSHSTDAH